MKRPRSEERFGVPCGTCSPASGGELDQAIDAQHNYLSAQGVTVGAGQPLADPAALQQWLHSRSNFLAAQLPVFPEQLSVAADLIITATNVVTITGGAPLSLNGIYVFTIYPNNSGAWSYCLLNLDLRNQLVGEAGGERAYECRCPSGLGLGCLFSAHECHHCLHRRPETARKPSSSMNGWLITPAPAPTRWIDNFPIGSSFTTPPPSPLISKAWSWPTAATNRGESPPAGHCRRKDFWSSGPTANRSGTSALSRDLHVPFGLDKGGDALRLFRADGLPLDEVIFGKQKKDKSAGRYPDGSPAIIALPTPTPGAPNIINARPLLSSICQPVNFTRPNAAFSSFGHG